MKKLSYILCSNIHKSICTAVQKCKIKQLKYSSKYYYPVHYFSSKISSDEENEKQNQGKEKCMNIENNNNKKNTIIEPTKYYNPVIIEEEFEKKFWKAYENKIQKENKSLDPYPDRIRYRKSYDNPVERTFCILRDDILEYFGRLKRNPMVAIRRPTDTTGFMSNEEIFPEHCDVVIIGGGIVGTAIAFHLKERAKDGLRVVVVEKDMSYSRASSVLSVGGIRQQFSTPENIVLSKYGMDFLQQSITRLAVDEEDPPKVDITFNGYLTLASEEGYPQLLENYELQKDHKSFVELLTKKKLKERFPWIKTDGIEAGVYGTQREGWFDPWSFLLALNKKTKHLGTHFVNGTVTDANFKYLGDYIMDENNPSSIKQVENITVTLPNGEVRKINCALCVIAAGAWSKDVGKIIGVGEAPSGINATAIPVEPRKRFVYCVKSPNGPSINCPLVIEPNGTYFRREGLADLYLCGRAPEEDAEPSVNDFSVDEDFFEDKIWPHIAQRCPSFENLKMHSSWAGFYDYNTFDQNAIIGYHPSYSNLILATGFSGHGIQQAAGAGMAISELIVDAEYKTLNLERLGFERILLNEPILEKCCY